MDCTAAVAALENRRSRNMTIDVRATAFALTHPIKVHAESLAAAALGPFSDLVQHATVRLDDVNATRGGVDKRCRVLATLRGRVLIAQALHEDLYVAIDKAARRMRRLMVRSIKRPLRRQRLSPQRPGALSG
jgi:ribosome-associated translation inhibitor RaiA